MYVFIIFIMHRGKNPWYDNANSATVVKKEDFYCSFQCKTRKMKRDERLFPIFGNDLAKQDEK